MIYVWSGKDLYVTCLGMPDTHKLAEALGTTLNLDCDERTGYFTGHDLTFTDYYYQSITDFATFEVRPTIELALKDARKFAGYGSRTTIGNKVIKVESLDSLRNICVRFVQTAFVETKNETL